MATNIMYSFDTNDGTSLFIVVGSPVCQFCYYYYHFVCCCYYIQLIMLILQTLLRNYWWRWLWWSSWRPQPRRFYYLQNGRPRHTHTHNHASWAPRPVQIKLITAKSRREKFAFKWSSGCSWCCCFCCCRRCCCWFLMNLNYSFSDAGSRLLLLWWKSSDTLSGII